jgi:hypothetical protein
MTYERSISRTVLMLIGNVATAVLLFGVATALAIQAVAVALAFVVTFTQHNNKGAN